MGLILDSSVLIRAERQGQNARQMLSNVSNATGNIEIAVSVIILLELAHGVAKADNDARKETRQRFIDELRTGVPDHPVPASMAIRAGEIDGHSQAEGVRIPLADLLIAVTALDLGYSVATTNVRHLRFVPGLAVTQM